MFVTINLKDAYQVRLALFRIALTPACLRNVRVAPVSETLKSTCSSLSGQLFAMWIVPTANGEPDRAPDFTCGNFRTESQLYWTSAQTVHFIGIGLILKVGHEPLQDIPKSE